LFYAIICLFLEVPPLQFLLLLIAVVTLLFFILSIVSISKIIDNDVMILNVSTIGK